MAFDNNDKENADQSSLDEKIHKSITARLARLNLDDLVGKSVEAAIEKAMSSRASKEDNNTSVVKSQPNVRDEKDAKIDKLIQEMKDKEAKSLAKIVAQQEKQALAALKAELKGKVIPDMDDMVAEWMYSAKKMISVDEDGEAFVSIGDDKLPLNEGVKKFLGSKEAKRFIPAGEVVRQAPKPFLDRAAPVNGGVSSNVGSGLDKLSPASITDNVLSLLELK